MLFDKRSGHVLFCPPLSANQLFGGLSEYGRNSLGALMKAKRFKAGEQVSSRAGSLPISTYSTEAGQILRVNTVARCRLQRARSSPISCLALSKCSPITILNLSGRRNALRFSGYRASGFCCVSRGAARCLFQACDGYQLALSGRRDPPENRVIFRPSEIDLNL